MTTVADEQVVALAQRGGEVEALDAAARPAPLRRVAAQDERGPVELAQHAGGHDAHDADVPEELPLDDDEVARRVEARANGPDDFVGDGALDGLALAVAMVEGAGDGFGGGEVGGAQEFEGFGGVLQAPGGIEARAELEAHFVGPNGALDASGGLEREQAGAASDVQPLQPSGDENTVLTDERHKVRDGAERDEVEQRADVEGGELGELKFAPALHERVGEFEGKAGGAEFGEVADRWPLTADRLLRQLRIHQRVRRRRGVGDLMVVEDEHIHAALVQPADGRNGG